ncbi:MAG: 50S ribosomal protein L4 [Actinobacteria bacterium]|nr:MAG: 50S ribosomal protein L4 [Actinomycetota bacterium]
MPTVEIRDVGGKLLGQRELPPELFDAPINIPVMHQVVVAGMAAQRAGTHSTKTRAEVSGGGRKPWRQKGTGRARHGSIRSPIWVGGGIAHGPQPRGYEMRVNKKMKRSALRSALTDALRSGKLAVVAELAFEGPKTKDAVAVMEALDLSGRVLLVITGPDDPVERSFRNLPEVKIDYPGNLSTYDLLSADRVLFTSAALDALTGERGPAFEEPAPEPSEPEAEEPEPENSPDEAPEEEEVVEP